MAFSSSSASEVHEVARRAAAAAAAEGGGARSMRWYCSTSEAAARSTSTSGTGRLPAPREVGARRGPAGSPVAAHARREVVELEEVGERVRVLLGVLQLLDEAQLALDQRLGAPRQVDEDRVERRPQHPPARRRGGPPRSCTWSNARATWPISSRVVIGVGTIVVSGASPSRRLRTAWGRRRSATSSALRRSRRSGRSSERVTKKTTAAPAIRASSRITEATPAPLRAACCRAPACSWSWPRSCSEVAASRSSTAEDARSQSGPRDLQREPRGAAAEDHLGQQVAVVDVRAHDGVGQPGVVGADRRAEVVDGDRAAQRGVARLVDRRGVDAARGDAGGDDGLDVGVLLAHHRQRVEAGGEPGDARVGGLAGQRPVEDLEGVDDLGVSGDRARGVHPAVDDVVAEAVELVDLGVGLVERRACLLVERVGQPGGAPQLGDRVAGGADALLDRTGAARRALRPRRPPRRSARRRGCPSPVPCRPRARRPAGRRRTRRRRGSAP